MKYIIKNRFSDEVIFEMEAESFKEAVEKNKANLHGADLHEADLRAANLYAADLRGADLRGADLHEADLRAANLHEARIKISQKEALLQALQIKIEE